MSMNDLIGDPFKEDRGEGKVFGENIADKEFHSTAGNSDLPDSKSNNVSFMKVEELAYDCKNLLAICEAYICYSVTQKKNLLRLIDTVTGEKIILRGHESSVIDIKFSPVDSSTLCSVDNGGGEFHTVVWKKAGDEKLSFQPMCQLPLKATLVEPHPNNSSVWAIADKSNIGIFSSQRLMVHPVDTYSALPMNISFESETVSDICFNPDGTALVAGLKINEALSYLQIWRIKHESGLVRGTESWTPVFNATNRFYVKQLLAVECSQQLILTVAKDADAENEAGSALLYGYRLQVWKENHDVTYGAASTLDALQSVTVMLPEFQSRSSNPSSSLRNPSLECSLATSIKSGKYAVLSSRKSPYVAIFALAPTPAASTLPVYHVTYLNLKAPVISMDVATVLGREHHSAEEGEHLEVSAFQEEASEQASIQQYHMLMNQLFDYQQYCQHMRTKGATQTPPSASTEGARQQEVSESKSKTILNLLGSMNAAAKPATPSSAAIKPSQTIAPKLTRLDSKDSETSGAAISPKFPLTSASRELLSTPQAKKEEAAPAVTPSAEGLKAGKSLLSKLAAAKPASAMESASATVHAPLISEISTPAPQKAPAAVDDDLPEFLRTHANHHASSILSMVKESSTTVTSTSAKKAEPARKAVESEKSPATPAVEGKKELLSSAALKAVLSAGSNGTSDVSHDHQVLASLGEIKATLQMLNSKAGTAKDVAALKEEVIKEIKGNGNLIVKANEQTQNAVKKAVEVETKKLVDYAFTTVKWKQELAGTVAESIQTEVVPLLTQKVRDAIKETVKDTVKSTLAASFRNSFESSLVPAFQAGIEKAFSQMQASFELGMNAMVAENQRAQQYTMATTERLEGEVQSLRNTVSQLETVIVDLAGKLAAAGDEVSRKQPAQDDPFTLLDKGLVSDAILRALENKDMSVTVALLDRLTPAIVTAKCSHLVRLCITQQLAADMSVNIPEEGIAKRVDWIKNLVLSLVSSVNAAIAHDPSYERNFKTMLEVVLQSIQAANRVIFSDNGEENAIQVPQSVSTDLQLLEFVISTKL